MISTNAIVPMSAIQPLRETRFSIVGLRKMAAAEAAVIPRLAPKYM